MKSSIEFARICLGLFYLVTLANVSTGYVAYFPLTDVHLTFPLNEQIIDILLKSPPFLQVNAKSIQYTSSNNSNKIRFRYEIDDTQNYLSINELNGEIRMEDNMKKLDENITIVISASSTNYKTNYSTNTARMSFKVVPENTSLAESCRNFQRICFWDKAMHAVPENKLNGNKMIGSLGPIFYRKICPNLNVKYSLVNATTYFGIESNMLTTITRFDHDSISPGPTITAVIKCDVSNKLNEETAVQIKPLRINILDRNDNPPEIQTPEPLTIRLEDPHFTQDTVISTKTIIFTDKDSISVNSNLSYELLNDTLDIIHPVCNAYENDLSGLKSTAISCKLQFSRNGILGVSPYCFGLYATDKTIDATNSFVFKSSAAKVCLITNVRKIHVKDQPAAQALQSKSSEESSSSASDESGSKVPYVDYPAQVTINRKYAFMARVAQPNISGPIKPIFNISDDSGAFGITRIGGIIYVSNVSAIQSSPNKRHLVTVSWKKGPKAIPSRLRIEILVADLRKGANVCKTTEISCSENDNKDACLDSCSVGTQGEGCQWRLSNATLILSTKYTTCSPNITTCPDATCDPLEQLGEQLGHLICPQDCSRDVFGSISSHGIGILAATGLCTCDGFGKCTCGPHDFVPSKETKENKPKKSEPMTVRVQQVDKSNYNNRVYPQCGVPCIILVILCPITLTIVIICLVISRRKYIKKNRKQMEINSSLNERRETETETLTDVPLVSIHTEFTFKNEGDPKWEFPRCQLVLDVVLGEGEFGKVVKGYATDIANRPGVTTVAVKMLKNGANSVELLALLSEYQLLQEVHHPNVIQLLGACTQESPLVIIEYAMYGSLRNYLRLSRKLECHGMEATDGVEPVTVKDILSFAWQICKGMTYLTEIKLVHRDLAARNVLLAEGKVCKVSDFGLTRDVYEDDAYLKRSKDRVPVKWMAPESLADHVYTTRSDVWAFGVLAWELITLGASPYPGIPPQNLYHLLKTGYRMERPENCSNEIYSIIKSCWADDSYARPSFKLLASQWEKLLGNSAKYLELDSNNGVSNPLYCSGTAAEEKPSSDDLTVSIAEEQLEESLDHLWRPPTSLDGTEGNGPAMGYDVPRPLIESKTTEQILRYQNDLTVPVKNNNGYKLPRISQQNIPVDLSHYDSPVKRRKSYVDMSGGTTYNLESQNSDKKKLSKDITFRFSSLLNLNEQMTSLM
ncbi:proto-oncogene tyrosine-protein kinase receptor Ret [Bradysia coprophila]|uniref:proto-oncogene tyrosine-protein kinase receptor Ret n=1 Tax=Bradysia coprophila TaxID=38358 RepID=UPI00187D73BC|nr:proto-oncogene tyrosine-protein kinase receptor Ret [Bradysia coprophila]